MGLHIPACLVLVGQKEGLAEARPHTMGAFESYDRCHCLPAHMILHTVEQPFIVEKILFQTFKGVSFDIIIGVGTKPLGLILTLPHCPFSCHRL